MVWLKHTLRQLVYMLGQLSRALLMGVLLLALVAVLVAVGAILLLLADAIFDANPVRPGSGS